MRIAVTGADGQLGTDICLALERHTILPLTLLDCDITSFQIVDAIQHLQPDLVIHTAAMTNVDGCARDPDQAFTVNALGTRNVALGCQRAGAEMLYISTNEVFDGEASSPYLEFAKPNPINVYGSSKHAGETFVQALLTRFYIVRTAWLFGKAGTNFVSKILKLADEQGQLRVVDDEIGSPTCAEDLAEAISKLVETHAYGVYHFVNSGMCSRYELTKAIMQMSGRSAVPVEPIQSSEFARASRPPSFSPLRNFCGEAIGISLRPWQDALSAFLATMEKDCESRS